MNTSGSIKKAIEFHSVGDLSSAEKIYKKVLQNNPDEIQASYLLGTLYAQQEKYKNSLRFLNKVISQNPKHAEALNSLGLVYEGMNEFVLAEKSYLCALEFKLNYLDAIRNLARFYGSKAENEKLMQLLDANISVVRTDAKLASCLGVMYEARGDMDKAEEFLSCSFHLNNNDQNVSLRLLNIFVAQGRLGDAITTAGSCNDRVAMLSFVLDGFIDMGDKQQALRVVDEILRHTSESKYYLLKSRLLNDLSFFAGAEKAVSECISSGYNEDALFFRAMLYLNSQQYIRASNDYISVLENNNVLPDLWVGLGVVLMKNPHILRQWLSDYYSQSTIKTAQHKLFISRILKVIDKSSPTGSNKFLCPEINWFNVTKDLFGIALELDANNINALNNMGYILRTAGYLSEAETYLRRGSDLGSVESKYNLSLCLLAQAKLAEGWDLYESRWGTIAQPEKPYNFEEWSGNHIADKYLFIYSEQGIGDELLFASCITDVLDEGIKCILECDPRLEGIFSRSFPRAVILPKKNKKYVLSRLVEFNVGYQIAIGSLPRLYRSFLRDFDKSSDGYLIANLQRVDYWQKKMDALDETLKVGFSWKSGKVGLGRIAPAEIDYWSRFYLLEKIVIINLQYGDVSKELKYVESQWNRKLLNYDELDMFNDIDDLAALISSLDVVVSIGNVVTALCGALGKPVIRVRSSKSGEPFVFGEKFYPWYAKMKLIYLGNREVDDLLDVLRGLS